MAMCMGNTGTITERSPIFAVFATGRTARLLKLNQANPLTVDDSWADNYYKDGNLKALPRLRFAGR